MTASQSFPALWYTSGTVIRTGQTDCAFKRFLNYHAGRHGTGFASRKTAIPLATGSGVHTGMELIGGWILDWQAANPGKRLLPDHPALDEVIGWGAAEAAAGYARKARARGLELTALDVDSAAATEQLILEQQTLIESQVWIYCLGRLPIMLAEHVLLAVEHEESPVIDCTCGLGDWVGQAETHAQRGCAGIVMQGKADFLWRHVDSNKIVYEEFKTKATPNYGWEQQWEHSGQLLINMEAASQRIGEEVSEAFVPVLFKGKRDRIKRGDQTSPKIQQSPLVWPWFYPGNGMNRPPEWASRWEWWDEFGKHTIGNSYKRQALWDESVDLPVENPNGVSFRSGASRVERWVKGWIVPAQYPDLLKVLGPYPKPRARIADAVKGILAEERRWRDDVEYLRNVGVFNATDVGQIVEDRPNGIPAQSITAADIIPRSWNCTGFDGTPCMFKPVCHREPGSERGIENMTEIYTIRTPHHSTEKVALGALVESLGLKWEESEEGDEE